MKAKTKYVTETGDKEPDNQIFYDEWYERYVNWLEMQVEKK